MLVNTPASWSIGVLDLFLGNRAKKYDLEAITWYISWTSMAYISSGLFLGMIFWYVTWKCLLRDQRKYVSMLWSIMIIELSRWFNSSMFYMYVLHVLVKLTELLAISLNEIDVMQSLVIYCSVWWQETTWNINIDMRYEFVETST